MNLSDAIIHGTLEEVQGAINSGATLDEVDAYGYTPLIQTAIVNKIDMAKAVIDAGADVNFTDLTGRSALHWAADNNNYQLCELLLTHGADPNAYTRAGQPVLTMPVLRHRDNLKELLYRHDGKLLFAQDFINGKLLGHRFELEGRVDVVDTKGTFIEIELEGFYLEFSLAIVYQSLMDFKINFGGKHLAKYFDKLQLIISAINNASELIKLQHYLIDIKEHQEQIDKLLEHKPLVIPVIYEGHAINFIVLGNIFVRCDRGAYGREHGTVIVYKMHQPQRLDKEFVKRLIYTRQYKSFVDEEMVRVLGLEEMSVLPVSEQVSGNCSWANVEAIVPSLMYLLLQHQKYGSDHDCQQGALYFFEEWIHWDKNRALTFCRQSFNRIQNQARKASKAALMAAILFQTYSFDNQNQRDDADKIMQIFKQNPDYLYILKAYQEVFQYDKETDYFSNFMKFIDYYEIDLSQVHV